MRDPTGLNPLKASITVSGLQTADVTEVRPGETAPFTGIGIGAAARGRWTVDGRALVKLTKYVMPGV